MKELLWLNKKTLEERWVHPYFCFINPDIWVKIPEGATFATGDKDNFVFRKGGWYYDNICDRWNKSFVTLENISTYNALKLLWVKGEYLLGIGGNKFTLERLLGCEVKLFGERFYLNENNLRNIVCICNRLDRDLESGLGCLTFLTEDGDEVTFDEYVAMYYGD